MKKATVLLAVVTAGLCSCGQTQTHPPEERIHSGTATERPKLIKTIGNPGYGNVQCGLQDKAGNLWFGTTQNGLYKYDGKSFTQFLVANGLNSNNIWSLFEDKEGKIWIGTEEGLCLYDGKTFAPIPVPLPKNLPRNKHRDTHEVFSIMQDKTGKLWFATIDGVYIYDGKSFTLFIVKEGAGGYMSSNNNAEKILEDKAGNIWFGGRANEGVFRYDGKSVTNIKPEELFQNGPRPKPHNWGWPQLQDKSGNIWFSNWGGVYRYDPSASLTTGSKSFTSFTASDGLTIGEITKIIEDRNGILWFGGAGGLCRYDGKSFTCFKDGLINPSIWEILEDKTGKLWVGTRATGLYLFDGKTFINYSEYKP
jgi:ligand-binding sensor domain-containing protein